MSEVVLLGTGAADGWPNPFCRCPSCTAARGRGELRSPTSVLVDDVLLLDCGPETARAANRAGRVLDRVHTILLTHEHPDHCDPSLLLWRSWVGVHERLVVAGPEAAIDLWRPWCGPTDPVEFRVVEPGDRFLAGGHDVRVLAANHAPAPGAVLYDVTTPDAARLLYATDTGVLPDSTVDACRGRRFDLVLLEETFGDQGQLGEGHHDLPRFATTVAELAAADAVHDATDVIAVHLGHHNPPLPELVHRLTDIGARVVSDLTVLEIRAGRGTTTASARPVARRVLVTGGARSGKSAAAERLVGVGVAVTYVATSPRYDGDREWEQRIATHRARRPPHWKTIELDRPADLAALLTEADDDDVLLVDCMTLWLTALVDAHEAWDDEDRRAAVDADVTALVDAWCSTRARVVVVTNEIGSGVVPATASGRYLRDQLGSLNARLSGHADEVRLVVAGRSMRIP